MSLTPAILHKVQSLLTSPIQPQIVSFPASNLFSKAQPTPKRVLESPEFQSKLDLLAQLTTEAEGVGMALPQIGVMYRGIYVHDPDMDSPLEPTFMINPQITILDKSPHRCWEGCLSVNGLRGLVYRPKIVRVDFFDRQGIPKALQCSGFHSSLVQHECDHLDGVLYINHVQNPEHLLKTESFDKIITERFDSWQKFQSLPISVRRRQVFPTSPLENEYFGSGNPFEWIEGENKPLAPNPSLFLTED